MVMEMVMEAVMVIRGCASYEKHWGLLWRW